MVRGVTILFVVLSIFGTWRAQVRIDTIRSEIPAGAALADPPEADLIQAVSFGYSQLAADLLWLKTVQVVGDRGVSCCYQWIYRAIDTVTTLDPTFAFAYQFGGLLLSTVGEPLALSDALLEKGERANPDVWQLPFYRGFNDYLYRKDPARAAAHVARAARLPGRPDGLPEFAARLYVQSGSRQTALDFLGTMIDDTEDETMREMLQERAKQILEAGRVAPLSPESP